MSIILNYRFSHETNNKNIVGSLPTNISDCNVVNNVVIPTGVRNNILKSNFMHSNQEEKKDVFSLTQTREIPTKRSKLRKIQEAWYYTGVSRGLAEPSLSNHLQLSKVDDAIKSSFLNDPPNKKKSLELVHPSPVELISSRDPNIGEIKPFSSWTKYTDRSFLSMATKDIVEKKRFNRKHRVEPSSVINRESNVMTQLSSVPSLLDLENNSKSNISLMLKNPSVNSQMLTNMKSTTTLSSFRSIELSSNPSSSSIPCTLHE